MVKEKQVIIVTAIFLLILALVAVVIVGNFTNWFKSKFSTFYLTRDKTRLFTDTEDNLFKNERFAVTYAFAKDKSYTVKVLPTGEDFSFTVDGFDYSYSQFVDVTTAFDIAVSKKSFSIRCKDVTMKDVLSRLFPGSVIEVDEEVELTAHFKLVVESADGKHSVSMTFKCYHSVQGVEFDKKPSVDF